MTNTIRFPLERARHSRPRPIKDAADVAHDLLAIANYLDATADVTNFPQWMRHMAIEVRRVAREMR